MRNTIFILVSVLILMAAFFIAPQYRIAQKKDYEQYLSTEHLQKSRQELSSRIGFWEKKLQAVPGNFVFQRKLAGLYAADFKLSGDIGRLQHSDSLLQLVNAHLPGRVGVLQSLAANAVTRHAFQEAEGYLREALAVGENKFSSSLMLADVLMERGNMLEAELLLRGIASRSHFDYLIRKVKFHDQSDKLGESVRCMEKAVAVAKNSGSATVVNWSLSNLADMYGHQGRVKKSYETYLEALRYDPADFHALKGIAWIAFSKDKNTAEARRILGFLQSVHPIPDYNLLLAEVAACEQDAAAEQKHRSAFIRQASLVDYGNMYRSYLCLLKSEGDSAKEALAMARQEIRERPHPMSYHLLAWAAFRNGDKSEALDILQQHVIGQTAEPKALYHAGIILKENGRREAAKEQFKAALGASFELGPVVTTEIKGYLQQL